MSKLPPLSIPAEVAQAYEQLARRTEQLDFLQAQMESHLEQTLFTLLAIEGLPRPVTQFRFHPVRRWRSDLAWPEQKLLVEVEGGIYTSGRHVRGAGYEGDCEKYNEAVLLGYAVLRVTAGQVESGAAVQWIKRALERDKI